MFEFLETIAGPERIFLFSAIGGGFAFLLLTLLMFITGIDFDGADADVSVGDTDTSFKGISFIGLAAFFLMFGLVGLAAVREFGSSMALASVFGAAAGGAAMWTLSKLMSFFIGMQSQGNLNTDKAVGSVGVVYLTVPETGSGQVQLTVDGRQRIMDAISASGDAIPTEARVRVLEVVEGSTLRVEPL